MTPKEYLSELQAFEIRKAMFGDIPTIAKMAVQLACQHSEYDGKRFDLTIFEPLELKHFEYLVGQFERDDTSFLVASLNNKIVGYAFLRVELPSLLSLDQKGVWLHDLFFEEPARGRGLAAKFFETIIDEAKRLGSGFLMLGVSTKNMAGQKFFAKMGFRPTMQEMRLEIGDQT